MAAIRCSVVLRATHGILATAMLLGSVAGASDLSTHLFLATAAESHVEPVGAEQASQAPPTDAPLHHRLFARTPRQVIDAEPSAPDAEITPAVVFVEDTPIVRVETPSAVEADVPRTEAGLSHIAMANAVTPGPLCLQDLLRHTIDQPAPRRLSERAEAAEAWKSLAADAEPAWADDSDPIAEPAAEPAAEPLLVRTEEPQPLKAPEPDPILSRLATEPTPVAKPLRSAGPVDAEQSPGQIDLAPLYGEPVVIKPPVKPALQFDAKALPRFAAANEIKSFIVRTAPPAVPKVAQVIERAATPAPIVAKPIAKPMVVALAPEPVAAPPADPSSTTPESPTDLLSRPLSQIDIDTAPDADVVKGAATSLADLNIEDLAKGKLGDWDAPAAEITDQPTRFPIGTAFSWAAPSVYHRPLYFEQPNVERYGHQAKLLRHGRGGLQSALSAAHFFGTIPVLPYLVGAEGACFERHYVLGSYRPGSCNPHRLIVPTLSLRGAVMEGAAWTGLAFFVP